MSQIQAQLLQLSPRERAEFLKNHADTISENEQFSLRYEGEEINQVREEYADASIHLSQIEEEFAGIKETYKAKLKGAKTEIAKLMSTLKQNGEWKNGTLFGFADHVLGTMQLFDEQGNLVSSRRLLPNERQMTIFNKASNQ